MEGDSFFTTFPSSIGGTCSCLDAVEGLATFEVGSSVGLCCVAPIESKANLKSLTQNNDSLLSF